MSRANPAAITTLPTTIAMRKLRSTRSTAGDSMNHVVIKAMMPATVNAAAAVVFDIAQRAMAAFEDKKIPLQVAVMGCVVNGPGEARDADLGIAAGNRRGHLFVKGQNVAVVPEAEMVDTLVEWAEFMNEHGTEAALARAAATKDEARRAAEEDRARNLDALGDDANDTATKVELIQRRTS